MGTRISIFFMLLLVAGEVSQVKFTLAASKTERGKAGAKQVWTRYSSGPNSSANADRDCGEISPVACESNPKCEVRDNGMGQWACYARYDALSDIQLATKYIPQYFVMVINGIKFIQDKSSSTLQQLVISDLDVQRFKLWRSIYPDAGLVDSTKFKCFLELDNLINTPEIPLSSLVDRLKSDMTENECKSAVINLAEDYFVFVKETVKSGGGEEALAFFTNDFFTSAQNAGLVSPDDHQPTQVDTTAKEGMDDKSILNIVQDNLRDQDIERAQRASTSCLSSEGLADLLPETVKTKKESLTPEAWERLSASLCRKEKEGLGENKERKHKTVLLLISSSNPKDPKSQAVIAEYMYEQTGMRIPTAKTLGQTSSFMQIKKSFRNDKKLWIITGVLIAIAVVLMIIGGIVLGAGSTSVTHNVGLILLSLGGALAILVVTFLVIFLITKAATKNTSDAFMATFTPGSTVGTSSVASMTPFTPDGTKSISPRTKRSGTSSQRRRRRSGSRTPGTKTTVPRTKTTVPRTYLSTPPKDLFETPIAPMAAAPAA